MLAIVAKPCADQRIEGHDGSLAAIAFERPADRKAQRPDAPVARLYFYQNRYSAGHLGQCFAQSRNFSMAIPQCDLIDIL